MVGDYEIEWVTSSPIESMGGSRKEVKGWEVTVIFRGEGKVFDS